MTGQPEPQMLLQVGDIVQIKPEHDPVFGGCLMIVEEPRAWGAVGYFDVPGQGRAYYRVAHGEMVKVGKCKWIPEDLSPPAETEPPK